MTQPSDPTPVERDEDRSATWLARVLRFVRRVHWLPPLLCGWSFWAQMTYRVPGHALFVILPWVNTALAAWSLAWWLGVLVLRLPSAGPLQRALLQAWAGVCAVILLFAAYGAVLFVNGRWDRSRLAEHASVVKDVRGVDTELGYVLPPWIELQAWAGRGTTRLPLRWSERDEFWASQPVLVQVRTGALGIPWVARIERDEERQSRRILQSIPTAAVAWKNLTDFYLRRSRWAEGKAALLDYLKLYPNDYEFARGCSVSFVLARRSADAVEIMEPFLERRPSYELYNILGFEYHKLGRRDRAVELLEASILLDPEPFDAYYHLGYVYSAMGKPQQAVAMFEEVLKRRPNFPEITAQVDRLRKQTVSQPSS